MLQPRTQFACHVGLNFFQPVRIIGGASTLRWRTVIMEAGAILGGAGALESGWSGVMLAAKRCAARFRAHLFDQLKRGLAAPRIRADHIELAVSNSLTGGDFKFRS